MIHPQYVSPVDQCLQSRRQLRLTDAKLIQSDFQGISVDKIVLENERFFESIPLVAMAYRVKSFTVLILLTAQQC